MPSDPILTVVLPVRNAAPYLSDALASLDLNARTLSELEVVAVDDGSDDDTPELLAGFAGRSWVRTLRHEVTAGLADARNSGLDAASGRYVTFLDGDDWLAPRYLGELVAVAERLGCDFVRTDHVQVTGRDRVVHHAPEWRRDVVLDPASVILPANRRTMVDYPYAWAGIYRRDLGDLLRFPAGLHTAEDRPWIWRLHREATSFAVTSLTGLFYRRQVDGSLTQTGDARQLQFLDAYALILAEADEPGLQAKAVRQFVAVLRGDLANEERFTPPLRAELADRGRGLLATIDPDVLARALPFGSRGAAVEPLLPAEVLRLRRSGLTEVAS